MREGNIFSLFTLVGGGYPIPGLGGGRGTQSQVWVGGTPSQVWVGGYPISGLGGGYPITDLDGGGYPGYP